MPATAFFLCADQNERAWIAATLAPTVGSVLFIDEADALFARLPVPPPACLLMFAEPDAAATLQLVRELRSRDTILPVVVLGWSLRRRLCA